MILVDTSVWIDHLRAGDLELASLLERREALAHPWVTGELALGQLSNRQEVLRLLGALPSAPVATAQEVLTLIETHRLFGLGIGYVDVHLLASTLLTGEARLWTRDQRLAAVASRLGVAAEPPS